MDEAVELLKTAGDFIEATPTFRVYTEYIGPFDTLVLEIEFEDLTGYERFWAAFDAAPAAAAMFEKWFQITKVGGTNEVWQLR